MLVFLLALETELVNDGLTILGKYRDSRTRLCSIKSRKIHVSGPPVRTDG